ncbi:MAG: hypothetical protein WBW31_14145, partial [Candidatus Sulfotelmatobacter sp.]
MPSDLYDSSLATKVTLLDVSLTDISQSQTSQNQSPPPPATTKDGKSSLPDAPAPSVTPADANNPNDQ